MSTQKQDLFQEEIETIRDCIKALLDGTGSESDMGMLNSSIISPYGLSSLTADDLKRYLKIFNKEMIARLDTYLDAPADFLPKMRKSYLYKMFRYHEKEVLEEMFKLGMKNDPVYMELVTKHAKKFDSVDTVLQDEKPDLLFARAEFDADKTVIATYYSYIPEKGDTLNNPE